MQVDCFSYGVVLWEIVTKEQAQRGDWRPVLVPEECPAEVEELLQASLASPSLLRHACNIGGAGLFANILIGTRQRGTPIADPRK